MTTRKVDWSEKVLVTLPDKSNAITTLDQLVKDMIGKGPLALPNGKHILATLIADRQVFLVDDVTGLELHFRLIGKVH